MGNFLLFIVLLFFLFFIFLSSLFFLLGWRDSFFLKIPFVSTRKRAIDLIIKALSLSKESLVYEPGCGSAHVLKAAVISAPGAKGIGTEKGYLPYIFSRINTFGLPISILYGDMLSPDFSQFTHIYCYLRGTLMEDFSQKILDECKKGTRIVSCDFTFPNIPLVQTISLEAGHDKLSRVLYIYEIK